MPKRTGLLASVAMPLISMSLMVPSAHAAMPSLSNFPLETHSQIIRVQDQPAAGGESEEELKLRQKKGAPQKEGEGRPKPPEGAERPRAPAGEAPRPPRAEPPPEARQPQEAPQQRRQAEPEAQPAPKPRAEPRPEPEQPKPRPAPKQEVAPEPKAAPEPKVAPEQKLAPEPKAAPVAPKAAPKEAPAARSEPQPEAKPAVKPVAPEPKAETAPEAPAAKPAAPKEAPAEKPAPKAEAPAEQPKLAPKGAVPAPAPDAEAPAGERPRRQGSQNGEQGQRPPREAPNGQAPNGAAPSDMTQPPAPGGKPAPIPPGGKPAPVAPGSEPPPAPSGDQRSAVPPAPPATPGAAAQTAETPKTPEDIQRAKKIAENPASATGPVVLPVQNGAAVLDSAKEGGAPQAVAPGNQPGQPGMPRDRRNGQRDGAPPMGGPQQAIAPNAPMLPPPTSDAAAQAAPDGRRAPPVRIEDFSRQRGERLDERPRFEDPRGWDDVRRADNGRVIIQFDNRTFVRHDDSDRFVDDGYRPEYERLPGDRTREVFQRDNGVQVVTIRNRYGEVIQRSRIGRDGREYVLFYAPELADERDDRDYRWRDPGAELPPMRLNIPVNQYIIDTTTDPDRDYYRFLEQPPVERVERVYSVDEVRYSARIRDKVRRIDLDTITFATGSDEIPMNQATSLRKVADAIKKVLDRDPAETFLIEGHTDAVGSDESNLVLSDRRAESVARVLTDAFGIPPENMVTQGYGERYLKVATDGPEQQNRRVTIRRITALVKPVAQAQ